MILQETSLLHRHDLIFAVLPFLGGGQNDHDNCEPVICLPGIMHLQNCFFRKRFWQGQKNLRPARLHSTKLYKMLHMPHPVSPASSNTNPDYREVLHRKDWDFAV